jgi:hypothetical protein
MTVTSVVRTVGPLNGGGMSVLAADEVMAAADEPEISAGIDGETVLTPTRCGVPSGRWHCRSGCQRTARGPPGQTQTRLADPAAAGLLQARTGGHGLIHFRFESAAYPSIFLSKTLMSYEELSRSSVSYHCE